MSSEFNPPDSNVSATKGYPLSMLFILVGVCGVLSGFIAPAIREWLAGRLSVVDVALASTGGGFLLGLVGASVGLGHHRRGAGILYGSLVGFGIGSLVGPLFVTPATATVHRAVVGMVGSFVILLIGLALRFGNIRR